MSYNRLGGGKRQTVIKTQPLTTLHINRLPDMMTAQAKSRRHIWRALTDNDREKVAVIGTRPVDGNKERLAKAVELSESLIADAIAADSRLAKRAQWRRQDEGEYCCAGLLASGDDEPFFKYSKAVVSEATMSGEPVRVVISTDDRNIPEGTAAAFIATARLVQQFVPLEIWWQGAWLSEDRRRGHVTLVPLVLGDFDFSRLEFCIADTYRDNFSFRVMSSIAVYEHHETWNGCGHRADSAYLRREDGSYIPNIHFIPHTGIEPNGESIAAQAASWLGWESSWSIQWALRSNATSAVQELPPITTNSNYTITDETRRRWAEEEKRAKAKQEEDAKQRMEHCQ